MRALALSSCSLILAWSLAGLVGCSSAAGGIMDPAAEPPTDDPPAEEPSGEEPRADDAGPSAPIDGGSRKDSGAGATKTDSGSSTPDTSAGGSGGDTGASSPPDSGPPESASGLPLVANLGISEIAWLQGVKIPVAKGGSKVTTRSADVIAGREALVRVYVTPRSGWAASEVVGQLQLVSAGGARTYTASMIPTAASRDAVLGSTLNFEIPSDVVAVDTRYSVTLFAKSGGGAGDTSGARYPAGGATESLDAKSTGEVLRIKIVPVRYDADGSGRLPDVSPTQIERYRQAFYAMYPARRVEITVRAPVPWTTTIGANGTGFSSVLQAMVKLRASDGAPKDVYYYGALAPSSSFSTYCGYGCVTGLCGLLTYPSDATGRACVGVGFTGVDSAQTAVHEIGHAHGRGHAPCSTTDSDSAYPYSGGAIGAWGFDLVQKKLLDPATTKDFMGYCRPSWISDYTYRALAARMSYVSGSADVIIPDSSSAPRTYRFVDVGGDGRLTWGDRVTLQEPPLAEPHTVRWLDASGALLGSATGHYYPYDDLAGGYMLVPEGPTGAASVAVSGFAASGLEIRIPRPAP